MVPRGTRASRWSPSPRAGRRPALAASRFVRVVPIPAPEDGVEASVDALRALVAAEQPAAILPLDDLGTGSPTVSMGPVPVAGPTGALTRIALDKREQLVLDRQGRLRRTADGRAERRRPAGDPRTASGRGSSSAPSPPCWTATGSAGPAAASPARWPTFPSCTVRSPRPPLVQPVIDGVGEGLFGIAVGGQAYALSAHRRIRMMNPRGSGSSAARSIPVDPALAEAAGRFVEASGWHGIFMLEFLRDDAGRPWFMELNGRTWGSMVLARHRGWPYPVWAVESALDHAWRPAVPPEGPHLRARHLGRELVHLLAVMRGARGADKGRWPTRRATLLAMLRPERGTRWCHARRGELRVSARHVGRPSPDRSETTHEQDRPRRGARALGVVPRRVVDTAGHRGRVHQAPLRRRTALGAQWTFRRLRLGRLHRGVRGGEHRQDPPGTRHRIQRRRQRGARPGLGRSAVLRPATGHRDAARQGARRGRRQRHRPSLAARRVEALRPGLGAAPDGARSVEPQVRRPRPRSPRARPGPAGQPARVRRTGFPHQQAVLPARDGAAARRRRGQPRLGAPALRSGSFDPMLFSGSALRFLRGPALRTLETVESARRIVRRLVR